MSDSLTTFDNKCEILGDFWLTYKNDPKYEDFISYNDLGLPLAYAVSANVVPTTSVATNYISETWLLFLELFGADDEDQGFDSLDDIIPLA